MRNERRSIWRILKNSNSGNYSLCQKKKREREKKKKSHLRGSSISPRLQSWLGGIYSKPHIIPCFQSHSYKFVHSLWDNTLFSVFSVKSLCLALLSISGLLQSSFRGHSSCSVGRALSSFQFSVSVRAD